MSVYIKGMKLPESCERCPMLDWDLDYIKCKATGRHFEMSEPWRTDRVSDCPLVSGADYTDLLNAAKSMHTWIFLNSADEQEAYDECGLSDEMNAILGYGWSFTIEPEDGCGVHF